MTLLMRTASLAAMLALSAPAMAQISFYQFGGFQGRTFTTDHPVGDFEETPFRDRASAVIVGGDRNDRWEVCEQPGFRGHCVLLSRGEYSSLTAMGLNGRISSVRAAARDGGRDNDRYALVAPVGQIDLYESEGFRGRSYSASAPIADLRGGGFNDRASSAVVTGTRWEVCEDARFNGRCAVLRPGQYPSLAAMGLNDRVSSLRAVGSGATIEEGRYAPPPVVSHDYRRRAEERIYEARVTAVRAVVEEAGQRCWVEREQVAREGGEPNVQNALIGAVLGGILGHQVGGGNRNVATGIGAVAGAAIGSNVGRQGGGPVTQDVQRCTRAPGQAHPAYWDVTYEFRGQPYQVQMTTAPGQTISVNEQGEPRV
jgi:uncharacterized protein YcfJ